MSDEVEESDGVMYSADEARRNWSRLLHGHETLLIPVPDDFGVSTWAVLVALAAVKSQCRLTKMGISEKARNR